MSELPKIDSKKSLRAWLEGCPREDSAIIADRAAMRAAPVWFAEMRKDWARKHDLTAIPILWPNLTSGVARVYPTPEVIATARAARAAAAADAPDVAAAAARAAAAAAYAARAARPAAADNSAAAAAYAARAAVFWVVIEADVHGLIHGEDIAGLPLWQGDNPLAGAWQKSQPILREDTPGGEFWIDWYQRALDGRPQNWPLLRDVALIDDALWKEGGAALDARIRELRQEHAIVTTANGERVEVNPETGRLRLVPVTELPDDLAHYVRRKIIKAVEVFDGDAGQSWRALAPDLAMLRRAVEDAGNLPVELFDACSSAVRRLAHRAENGECPAPEQDALIADYRDRLRDAGADILANDPEAQKVLERRAAIAGNDALIEAGSRIAEAVEVMQPLLEGRLADALPEDAATAMDPDAGPEERAEASFRFSGRMLRIVQLQQSLKAVRKGFVATGDGIIWTAAYLKALEYLATSPIVQDVLEAIFRFL